MEFDIKTHVFLLLIVALSFSLDASARENDNSKNLKLKNESEQESRTVRKSEKKSEGIQKAPYSPNEYLETGFSSFVQDGPFTYYAAPGPTLFSKQEWDSFPTLLRMYEYSRAYCGNYQKNQPPYFGFTRHVTEPPPPPMIPTYNSDKIDPKTSKETPAKKSNEK